MNVIRGQRQHAEAGRADGAGGGILSRRGVLGGLAALPVVLYGVGSAAVKPSTPTAAFSRAQATISARMVSLVTSGASPNTTSTGPRWPFSWPSAALVAWPVPSGLAWTAADTGVGAAFGATAPFGPLLERVMK